MALEEMEQDIRILKEEMAQLHKATGKLIAGHPQFIWLKDRLYNLRKVLDGTYTPVGTLSQAEYALHYLSLVEDIIRNIEE